MRRMGKHILYLLMMSCLLQSCTHKPINWEVNLEHDNKDPYGTYLAFTSLSYCFPGVDTKTLSRGFRYDHIDDKMKYGSNSLLILAGLTFDVSEEEIDRLMEYASTGNELLIFSSTLDKEFSKRLGIRKLPYGTRTAYEDIPLSRNYDGSKNSSILKLKAHPGRLYGYFGRYLTSYFVKDRDSQDSNTDTSGDAKRIYISPNPDTLGTTDEGPDFIRIKVGEGHITLHAAPLVLSNYFLLQEGNKQYIETLWQSFPKNISRIYWNDYYKRSTDRSDVSALMRHPATRMAVWLAVLGLIIYILFEGKRRQRIIPIMEAPQNSSVSFVETVGRLYYNKGDHRNLAEKMIQHFLEWVRNHYHINTNHLNEDFVKQLVTRSGQDEAMVRNMMEMIHEIRNGHRPDDAYLYQLYNSIEQFYKNKS
ncbi:MAG: DUF4350 domain-containing protein [Bacteroidetes bacterium]|nr:DUF4350 domain-containing protein [Bacteroidota bacterium]